MSIVLDVSRVGADGLNLKGSEEPDFLELDDEFIRPNGPVSYDFQAYAVSDQLIIQGWVQVPVEVACARCACFFSTKLQDSTFLRACDWTDVPACLDLSDDVREALLLQLEPFPLCGDACRGLCPVCGINLNTGSCTCRTDREDDRWGPLDQLKL